MRFAECAAAAFFSFILFPHIISHHNRWGIPNIRHSFSIRSRNGKENITIKTKTPAFWADGFVAVDLSPERN